MKRLNFKDISIIGDPGSFLVYEDKVAMLKAAPGAILEWNSGDLLEFDVFVLSYTTCGSACIQINGKGYELSAHSLCVVTPAHTTRVTYASPDYRASFLLLRTGDFRLTSNFREKRDFKSWIDLYFNPVMYLNEEESASIEGSIDYLASQMGRKEPENVAAFVTNAMTRYQLEVDYFLHKRLSADSDAENATSRQGHIVESLALKIVNNYKSEHRAQYYADEMCFSLQYLNKLMNAQVGMTVGDVISKLLYTTARSLLLSSDLSIQQISQELNFSNQATFCRFFKNIDGQSPSELRRNSKTNVIQQGR